MATVIRSDEPLPERPFARRILFLGDSNTQGEKAFPFLQILGAQLPSSDLLINAGRNSDTVDVATRRWESLISYKPTHLYIMLGSNDAMCEMNYLLRLYYLYQRGHWRWGGISAFNESYLRLLRLVESEKIMNVRLVTVPPIGECTDSWGFAQSKIYADAIIQIAQKEKIKCVDFFSAIAKQLPKHGLGFNNISQFLLTHFGVVKKQLVWTLDFLHLNQKSAEVLSGLILKDLGENFTAQGNQNTISMHR